MSDEPKKSGYWTDPQGNRRPDSEYQNVEDLMEISDNLQDHPEGSMLGWIITSLSELVGDPGTTCKDVRGVRTGEGFASFLLTDHEHPSARVTLTFEDGKEP
jgi:hypothetical protein